MIRHPLSLLPALLTLAIAALGATTNAGAAPIYLIDVTSDLQSPAPDLSNVAFSLTYEDLNLDRLFSLDELLVFTGYSDAQMNYFPNLLGVPDAPGITGNAVAWIFGDGTNTATVDAARLASFTSGPLDGSVPEPASLALVAAALWGVRTAAGRRRRDRAALAA